MVTRAGFSFPCGGCRVRFPFSCFGRFSCYVPCSRSAYFSLFLLRLGGGCFATPYSVQFAPSRGTYLIVWDISIFWSIGRVYGSLFIWYSCSLFLVPVSEVPATFLLVVNVG